MDSITWTLNKRIWRNLSKQRPDLLIPCTWTIACIPYAFVRTLCFCRTSTIIILFCLRNQRQGCSDSCTFFGRNQGMIGRNSKGEVCIAGRLVGRMNQPRRSSRGPSGSNRPCQELWSPRPQMSSRRGLSGRCSLVGECLLFGSAAEYDPSISLATLSPGDCGWQEVQRLWFWVEVMTL